MCELCEHEEMNEDEFDETFQAGEEVQVRPRINAPLLTKVLHTVEQAPVWDDDAEWDPSDVLVFMHAAGGAEVYLWDQRAWIGVAQFPEDDELIECGTTLCFAGFTALIAGAEFAAGPVGHNYSGDVILDDGTQVTIERYAQSELGLTKEQADRLFYGENNLDSIRTVVAEFVELAAEQERSES